MKNQKILQAVLVLPVLLLFSGCVAVVAGAAGAGTVGYLAGELRSPLEAPVDRAWQAVEATINERGYMVTKQSKDARTGILESRTADDQKVTIRVTEVTEDTSEVRIRVGTFGDEKLSLDLIRRIEDRL